MVSLVKPGFLGRLGGSVAGGLSPIFHPILTTLTNQFGGEQVNPSIRNSTAMVKVWDSVAGSILRTANIDEARRQGMRRVENLLKDSEFVTSASGPFTGTYGSGITATQHIENGQTYARWARVTASGYNGMLLPLTGAAGTVYRFRFRARQYAGQPETTITIKTSDGSINTSISITSTWEDYATPAFTLLTAAPNFQLFSAAGAVGDAFEITKVQLEDVTGQSNQNPSEYVPTGATSVVQYFATTNGNTVDANNIVTEAQGQPLFPSKTVDGVKVYQTKPDWAAGINYAAGAEVNYNGRWYSTVAGGTDVASFGDTVVWVDEGNYSPDLGLLVEPATTNTLPTGGHRDPTVWSNLIFTPTAANNATGIDGVANTAMTITDGDTTQFAYWEDWQTVTADTQPHVIHAYFRKTTAAATYPGFGFYTTGGVVKIALCTVNTDTGVLTERTGFAILPNATYTSELVHMGGFDWWHVVVSASNDGAQTVIRHSLLPAVQTTDSGAWNNTLTGSCIVDWVQTEQYTSIPTSPMPGNTTRATEGGGNINWPITGNFNNANGSLILEFIPESAKHAASNRGLVSVDGTAPSASYMDTTGLLASNDGTNVASSATAYVAEPITKAIRWSTSLNQLQVGVLLKGQYGATWSWGTAAAYDGAFTLGALISLAIGMDEPIVFRNPPIIYSKCLSTTEIEQKFGV